MRLLNDVRAPTHSTAARSTDATVVNQTVRNDVTKLTYVTAYSDNAVRLVLQIARNFTLSRSNFFILYTA